MEIEFMFRKQEPHSPAKPANFRSYALVVALVGLLATFAVLTTPFGVSAGVYLTFSVVAILAASLFASGVRISLPASFRAEI